MKKTAVVAARGPAALGPYSPGISSGELVFLSGQLGIGPDGALAEGGVAGQAEQCLRNAADLLKSAGLTLDDAVKTTVFMTDLGRFAEMNEVYARHFKAPYPARSTVQVAALPKGAAVEIEIVAVRP